MSVPALSAGAPTVSVMIPNYNYGRFVCDAVRSALAQSGVDVEVCVVDNASTDDSVARLRDAFGNDPRVHVVVNERNVGIKANFVRCFELARGEHVTILCADDLLLPGHLARALAFYQAHPEVDYLHTGYTWVDEHLGNERYIDHPGHLGADVWIGRDDVYGQLRYESYVCMPTVVFTRALLATFGSIAIVDAVVSGDYEQFSRYALAGARSAFLAVPGARIRRHGGNASGVPTFVANGTQAREFLRVVELIAASEPPAHQARAALALLEFRERELSAGWPEAYAAFARDCSERVRTARAQLVAAAARVVPERPLVSVVLTTRGDVARLRDALASVAAQSYERWEIVLAPLGAPDLEPLLADLPYRARIVRFRKRVGFSNAAVRNTALALASGDVVAYLDELDLWTPQHLETVVAALQGSEAQIVRTAADLAIEWRDPAREYDRALVHVEPLPLIDPATTLVSAATPLSTLAIRRDLLERIAFEELPFLEDWDFALRAMLAGPVASVTARTVRVGHEAYPLEPFIAQWPLCASIVDAVHRRAVRADDDPMTATRHDWRERLRAAAERARANPATDTVAAAIRILHGAA